MRVKPFAALRRSRVLRFVGLGLAIASVVLATVVVSTLTIDLGPWLRGVAEAQGSRLIKRPIHIGALRLRVIRGRIDLDDLLIEGVAPTDRPFFTAKRLSFSLDW